MGHLQKFKFSEFFFGAVFLSYWIDKKWRKVRWELDLCFRVNRLKAHWRQIAKILADNFCVPILKIILNPKPGFKKIRVNSEKYTYCMLHVSAVSFYRSLYFDLHTRHGDKHFEACCAFVEVIAIYETRRSGRFWLYQSGKAMAIYLQGVYTSSSSWKYNAL